MTDRRRVVVVGGGISGLTVAHRLMQSGIRDVVLVEAEERLGGKIRTATVGDVRVEAGADSFVTRKPWAIDLCTELGLEDQLVVPGESGAFVLEGGRLRSFPPRSAFGIPSRPSDLLRWEALPFGARLRAVLDLYRPARRAMDDEPLGRLLRRRLGVRAATVLVEPLLAGLHAGDPMRLSTAATFPELATWELKHGSLIRGARIALKQKPSQAGARAMFATVWGGLDRMVAALAARIGPHRIRLGEIATGLGPANGRFSIELTFGPIEAEAVVLATPAFESARVLSGVNEDAGRVLSLIPYASTAVVTLIYPAQTAGALPKGTGYVVPAGGGMVTACTWVSRKWPSDDLGTQAVVRCFVGRAGDERALALPDDRLIDSVRQETEAVNPMQAPPVTATVTRWPRAMPQYEVGHLERVEAIERSLQTTPGLFVTGSAYRGVGIPDCIFQASRAAERVLGFLAGKEAVSGQSPQETNDQREAIGWTR
jgi:oxygen-dependent protoporphyrinogen oxidase